VAGWFDAAVVVFLVCCAKADKQIAIIISIELIVFSFIFFSLIVFDLPNFEKIRQLIFGKKKNLN
jgi:hypothetical protein